MTTEIESKREEEKEERLQKAAKAAISWCEENRRPLPWREDPTPYHVWISEIMLQQTRIETVIPYYERFLKAFPTVSDLAKASEERVLKAWEGLGYYGRAKNLLAAAKILEERFGGDLPHTAKELQSLPGIGAYTAGAIASIACGKPEPAVDGNVLRLLSRLFADERDIQSPRVKREQTEALRTVYPRGKEAGLLTEGLMELGETLCLPGGAPRCAICPLQDLCLAHQQGREREFPVRGEKKEKRVEARTVLLLIRKGRCALRKRPETGLLPGLWELPSLPGHLEEEEVRKMLESEGFSLLELAPCPPARHVFTHLIWEMRGYRAVLDPEKPLPPSDCIFATQEEIRARYAVPSALSAFLKLL